MYAVVFCLIWFNVVYPTFESYSLYEMGTMIYVGLVFAMHLKVAFLHHLWNQIHFWSMFISVGGLFLFLYILNAMQSDNYDVLFVVNKIYSLDLFWFFGVFSVPLFCMLIDIIGYAFYFIFAPTREMLYREAAQDHASVVQSYNRAGDGYVNSRASSVEMRISSTPSSSDVTAQAGKGVEDIVMASVYEDNSSIPTV
jgi:hypothetical protein